MENFDTNAFGGSLPPDVPEQVHLFDQDWLRRQTSQGARLALIERDEDQRARSLAVQLGASQLEVDQLRRELEAAKRPLWKRLFSRA